MATDTLTRIADELFALTPDDFTAARNERVRDAKDSGDATLAARLKELRKPSPAAWVVNILVRERSDEIAQLLELGASLREATADLDRDALASLGKQRRQVVMALARQGGSLAESRGRKVTPAVVDEVARTLQAAMTDEDAADAVTTGRLLRSLEVDGMEPVDLDGAVAGAIAKHPSAPKPAPIKLDEQRRQKREAAEKEAAAAKEAADSAKSQLTDAEARVDDATHDLGAVQSQRDALREQLEQLEEDLEDADRSARALSRKRDELAREAAEADRKLTQAEHRLERLS
ncbi:hypothetical protein BH09ACT1_BH09ACT1_20150 [soil metagenome]